MPTERPPSPTSDNRITSPCSSSQPTLPCGGKQNQPIRPSEPGLKMLSSSCRTAFPVPSIFEDQDLDTYTESVLFYIKCCAEEVSEEKHIRVFPNRKPWMTSKVQGLIRARNLAFRTGDRALYSTARADLKRGIKQAKKEDSGGIPP